MVFLLLDHCATVDNIPFPAQYLESVDGNLPFFLNMVLCITYQDFANCSLAFAVAIPCFENVALHCCEHRLVVCPEREISKKGSSPLRLFEGITVEKQKYSSQNLSWNFKKYKCDRWCRKGIFKKLRYAALQYKIQC